MQPRLIDIKKDADKLLLSAEAQKMRLSFFYFIQVMWDTVVPDTPKWNWHIPFLCAELSNMVNRVARKEHNPYDILVNISPGTTKSLIFGVFLPAWTWINHGWMKFIKTSYSASLSLEHAELCRDVVRSHKYQMYFPYLRIKRDKDTKSNFRIMYFQNNMWHLGGNLYSTSVGGTVTGYHAHINLIDDPIDPFKAYSEVELASANKFLSQVLPTRSVDKDVTATCMIMQRVTEGDPSDEMLKLAKKGLKVKHICLPAKLETKEDENRVKPPELKQYYQNGYFDPVRLGEKAIQKLKFKLGQYGFASQLQQDDVTPGGLLFDVVQFKKIKYEKINWEYALIDIVRYWDKAATDDGGAFTAGVKLARLKNDRYVVLDVVHGQWSTNKRERIIKSTGIADGPSVLQITEQEGGSGGKDSANSTISTLKSVGIKCIADRPTGNKVFRADPWSVRVNEGQVYLIKAPWNDDYINEHRKFPNGKYKDQVDASSGAYSQLFAVNRAGVW